MRSVLLALAVSAVAFAASPRPKVRAITAFVRIDPAHPEAAIDTALTFLSSARQAYAGAGFVVEGVRISTQPFPDYTRGLSRADALVLLRKLDALTQTRGFMLSIGPAMLHDADDPSPVDLLADFLSAVPHANATLVVAAEDGIHWKALRQSARLIKTVSERSPHGQGNLNFGAIAMQKEYCPFFPASWHTGSALTFAVGLEGAGVVADVFAHDRDPVTAQEHLASELTHHLRDAEAVATHLAASSGWTYAGLDPTPAPLGDVSIARAMESFIGGPFGSSGTMTAAAIITRAVQSVPVKRVGYSGLMLPVLEDAVLAKRWSEGAFTIDSLLAYSAVCAGGLDTVPLPGAVSEEQIAHIVGDVATLAYKWNKPLCARLLPIPGRKAGEQTEFSDARMGNVTIQAVK
jgi:uncharacterized protein (UPF0210 family)